MANLITKLKEITGRKLTDKEIKESKGNIKPTLYAGIPPEYYKGPVTCLFETEEGIVKIVGKYELTTTDDISEGSSRQHTNFYLVKKSTSKYNHDGLIESKLIEHQLPCGPATDSVEYSFVPAGSFNWHIKKITRVL